MNVVNNDNDKNVNMNDDGEGVGNKAEVMADMSMHPLMVALRNMKQTQMLTGGAMILQLIETNLKRRLEELDRINKDIDELNNLQLKMLTAYDDCDAEKVRAIKKRLFELSHEAGIPSTLKTKSGSGSGSGNNSGSGSTLESRKWNLLADDPAFF